MLEKLTCSGCDAAIGYVHGFDLEGSRFYCAHCAAVLGFDTYPGGRFHREYMALAKAIVGKTIYKRMN